MKLLIVACLVALASAYHAEDEHGCGMMQRLKVKRQWTQAFGISEEREAMGLAVFRYIVSKRPESVDKYFLRVNGHDMHSPEFLAHTGRILSGFDMCLSMLTDQGPLDHQLAHLKHQHEELHIPAEYFDIFSEGLQLSVHAILGRCYDAEAWKSCTNMIEDGIKHQGE